MIPIDVSILSPTLRCLDYYIFMITLKIGHLADIISFQLEELLSTQYSSSSGITGDKYS